MLGQVGKLMIELGVIIVVFSMLVALVCTVRAFVKETRHDVLDRIGWDTDEQWAELQPRDDRFRGWNPQDSWDYHENNR